MDITPPPTEFDAQTLVVRGGRDTRHSAGLVNTPVYRGSTILAASLDEWERSKEPDNPMAMYGRFGTPTTRSLESLVARLEGGYRSMVFPSGLSACSHALLSFLRTGDHVLMTDSAYGPMRAFAHQVLARFGVEVTFFDPLVGGGIRDLMRPNTRVVYVESPGSWTFEVQDIPAIAAEAHRRGARVVMDNTWASPLYFKPFEHGVDVSVQAATKYLVGHSDALLGIATANQEAWQQLQRGSHDFGQIAGPDDIYLALRGIRTLDVRLQRHWENGMRLAESMRPYKLVQRILHPALPDDPGHAIWKRDFRGASGLFGVLLQPMSDATLSALFGRLRMFGLGLSWGGYESLALPSDPRIQRATDSWPHEGRVVRIHAGLENIDALVEDMRQAFDYAARLG